jgi:hypothetical protein
MIEMQRARAQPTLWSLFSSIADDELEDRIEQMLRDAGIRFVRDGPGYWRISATSVQAAAQMLERACRKGGTRPLVLVQTYAVSVHWWKAEPTDEGVRVKED